MAFTLQGARMTLLAGNVSRERLHTRRVIVEGFRRSDGLWDIEGRMTDRKDHDYRVAFHTVLAGEALHDMWLCITVDSELNIVAAAASMDAIPVQNACPRIVPNYQKLVGLKIGLGFKKKVSQVLGGLRGCAHLTELLGPIATTAYQTLATWYDAHPDIRPFWLDGCHTWDTAGAVVEQVYPQWYRKDAHLSVSDIGQQTG